MENRYLSYFDDETFRVASRVVNRFLGRYAIFFGSLDFDDLMQECLFYYYVQKKRYWEKAEAAGMTEKAYLGMMCNQHLNHMLRDLSRKGRGAAAVAHKDFGDRDSVGFNDAGDLDIIENLFAGGLCVNPEENLILKENCFRVYKKLNEFGKKVFVLMVNDNLNSEEIAEDLGYKSSSIRGVQMKIREKAFDCFSV